jgi:hypothetical protein
MSGVTRRPDWLVQLSSYVSAGSGQAFCYGHHDCALFAAGAVAAMTGQDFAAQFRGRYTTLRGGLRILRQAGFADHVALAASFLPACHPSTVLPGDLAVFDGAQGAVLGVVQGQGAYILDPAGRVALRSMRHAVGAFRV